MPWPRAVPLMQWGLGVWLVLSFTALVVEQCGQAGDMKRTGAGASRVDGMGLCVSRADGRGNVSHADGVGSASQSDGGGWVVRRSQTAEVGLCVAVGRRMVCASCADGMGARRVWVA
jgi:hypothetical protein